MFGTFSASSNFFALRRYNKFLLLCKELPEAAEHSARYKARLALVTSKKACYCILSFIKKHSPCLLHHALVLGAAAGVGVVTGVTLILVTTIHVGA